MLKIIINKQKIITFKGSNISEIGSIKFLKKVKTLSSIDLVVYKLQYQKSKC